MARCSLQGLAAARGEIDGDRHALPQLVGRLIDDDAEAIDQRGAQFARLHRLRREFGGRVEMKPTLPL